MLLVLIPVLFGCCLSGLIDGFIFGIKYVAFSSNECAILLGRDLTGGEVALGREEMSVPCASGAYAFNLIPFDDSSKLVMCFLVFDPTAGIQCVKDSILGMSLFYFNTSLSSCDFDQGNNELLKIQIRSQNEVHILSPSTSCICTGSGCSMAPVGNKTISSYACPIYDAFDKRLFHESDENCQKVLSFVAGNYVSHYSDSVYFVSKDSKYYKFPEYDFIYSFNDGGALFPILSKMVLFKYMEVDGLCAISLRYAFNRDPFYYFQIVTLANETVTPVCFNDSFKIGFVNFYFDEIFYVGACFMQDDGMTHCGYIRNSVFVHNMELQLDLSFCNFTSDNFAMEMERLSPTISDVTFCPENMSVDKCCQFSFSTNDDIRIIESSNNVSKCAHHIPGAFNVIRDGKTVYSYYSELHYLSFAGWDGLMNTHRLIDVYSKRLYALTYKSRHNKVKECWLEIKIYGDRVIRTYPTPCIPEDAIKLFHLVRRRYWYLEVCFYDESRHALVCSESFTNVTNVYQLNNCIFFSDTKQIWIYGNLTHIAIGGSFGGCEVVRKFNGEYSVARTDSTHLESTEFGSLDFERLGNDSVEQFDIVNGHLLYTINMTVYDLKDDKRTEVATGYNYAFYMTRTEDVLYLPENVPITVVCINVITLPLELMILFLDVALLLTFCTVYLLEIRGFKMMKYHEIKADLLDQKMKAMEAIGRVLV